MSTIESLSQKLASNGWQNIGICKKFARHNVPLKLRALWMELVEDSFGYCEKKTKRISQQNLANLIGMSRPTVTSQIKELESLNLIKIIDSNKFVKGGGSEACAYAPCYPKGFGKLNFKEINNSGSEVIIETEEPEVEWNKEKNIDF